MTGCPDADTLAALDQLAEAERARIADHAAGCEACHAVIADLLEPMLGAGSQDTAVSQTMPISAAPAVIDRYVVESRLGAGAMGIVYKAHDPELDRPVAVKLLRIGASADRLRREAQALAKLSHANVVAVYDVGEHAESTFVAMALVDGDNLRTWLRTPRTAEQIIDVIVQAARGVAAAHAAGIVHRDLKPDNIFVGRSGQVQVGDFGLARSDDTVRDLPRGVVGETSSDLTRTGTVLGTPAYMPPEQAYGDASAASDQFSLCITAWEALYGSRPFEGATLDQLIEHVRRGPPPEPRTRRVPARISRALRRGLAAEPTARHPSVDALIAELALRRRRAPRIVAGTAVVFAAAAGLVIATRSNRDVPASCRAPDPLATSWQPARRVAAWTRLSALDGGGAIYASRMVELIDGYAAALARVRTDACTGDGEVLARASAVVACVERRAATLDDALPELGAGTAEHTALRLEGLEAAAPCASAEPASVATGVSRPALAALQREVDLLDLRTRSGDDALIGVDLDALAKRAGAVGDPVASAQVLQVVGSAAFARGRTPEAEAFLRKAVTLADAARHDRVRARASSMLVELLARTGRLGEAGLQHEAASAALARIAADPITERAVEHSRAVLARARGQDAAELAAMHKLVDLASRARGSVSASAIAARFELTTALQNHGRNAEAAVTLDEALRTMAQLYGRGLDPLDRVSSASMQALMRGDLAAAIRESELAVIEARRRGGAELVFAIHDAGSVYETAGELIVAERRFTETIAMLDSAAREHRDDQLLLESLEAIGRISLEASEAVDTIDDEMRARLARGLAATERGLGMAMTVDPTGATRDILSAQRGRILVALERWEEALPLLRTALTSAENTQPRRSFSVGTRAFALTRALWEVGGPRDRDRARALAEQAQRELAIARKEAAANATLQTLVDMIDRTVVRIEAWRAAHR